jgi:internalin A
LSPLDSITTLKELSISAQQLPGLQQLLHNNIITLHVQDINTAINEDLSPIRRLPNLEVLDLTTWGPHELDLSPLRHLKRLTWLRINGFEFDHLCPVRGIDAIGELSDLKTLVLAGLRVTDLAFVSNLRKLNDLALQRIPINNVTALSRIKSLKTVDLSRTFVVDISPLLNLPELTTLVIVGTPARSDVITALEHRGVKVVR